MKQPGRAWGVIVGALAMSMVAVSGWSVMAADEAEEDPSPMTTADREGPLALLDGPVDVVADADVGLGPGTIRITDSCVVVRMSGELEPVTLVWPGGSTAWRPESGRIVLIQPDGGRVRLTGGDRLLLHGRHLQPPGLDVDDGTDDEAVTWLTKPDASCPERLWYVTRVERPVAARRSRVQAIAAANGWGLDKTRLELRRAQLRRESLGFASSMRVVRESYANPDWYAMSADYSLPFSASEFAALERRHALQAAARPVFDVARPLDGFVDVYWDNQQGGIPVFLFTDGIEAAVDTIAAAMPDDIAFEVRQVEYTTRQLRQKQRQITRDMVASDWVLDGNIAIAEVGDGVIENRVLVGLIDADDEERARAILQNRYGPMVDVEFIGPSQQDPATG
jgi:hypothetical protein